MGAAKILAADDEADFELLITQRFRRQIREREFAFRFAHLGEEALALALHSKAACNAGRDRNSPPDGTHNQRIDEHGETG